MNEELIDFPKWLKSGFELDDAWLAIPRRPVRKNEAVNREIKE